MLTASLLRFHEQLHSLAKILAAEVNLSRDGLPRIVRSTARISDKSAIALSGRERVSAELPKSPLGLEPRRRGEETGGSAVVAPLKIARESHHAASNGIENDVANELEQVTFSLNDDAFESSLEKVADSLVSLIESDCAHFVEPLHAVRKSGFRSFDEKMVVIRHEYPRMQQPAMLQNSMREQPDEAATILFVSDDFAAFVTPAGDVPEGTWMFES